MREVVFRILVKRPGHLEAREALTENLGPAHCACRVRVRHDTGAAVSSIQPVGRRPAALCR